MAGRPRTMHRKVNDLASRAQASAEDLWELKPGPYRERSNPRDSVREAWQAAMSSAIHTHHKLEALAALVAEKIPAEPVGSNTPITIDGETMTLAEWARLYNNPQELILKRVKVGFDWERAITTPADMVRLVSAHRRSLTKSKA